MELGRMKPEMAQIALQVAYAGMNVLTRAALVHGISQFVFITYRQTIAALAIAPLAYITEKKARPPMTVAIFSQIFLLSLLGITFNQNFWLAGMYYTGSTFASAMSNLLPACTFVLAVIFGLEEVKMETKTGKAKVVGTLACVGGAMVMTFYRGPSIILHFSSQSTAITLLGSSLLMGSVFSWSAWLILQVYVIKKYPAHLSMVSLMLILGALQSGIIALLVEGTTADKWTIGWNMDLFTILYSAIFCSSIALFIQSWCVEKRGPVFVAVFNPFATILVAIMECLFLHYILHVGSVIGGGIIILGLYLVLWGKAKSKRDANEIYKLSISNMDEEGMWVHSSYNDSINSFGDIKQPLLLDCPDQNEWDQEPQTLFLQTLLLKNHGSASSIVIP